MRTQLQLFERSHGFMFLLNGPELRFTFANAAYLRLIGEEDVMGRRLLDVMPDIEPDYLDIIEGIRRTGEVFVGRSLSRMLHKGGVSRTLYMDIVGQPIFGEEGGVEAVFCESYDVTDKVDAEERLKLLLQEVDHRANNLLAVAQSIVNLTKANSVEELRRNVLGRIGALARAHQLLSDSRWRGADLQTLVEVELRPYTLGDVARAYVQGPGVSLSPPEAEGVSMAIHELATNSAKYGAFSTPAGRVEVVWTLDSLGARHIRWREDGGPPVVTPDRKGFGTRLLERALAALPGGRTQLFWRPEGLVCEFHLPPKDHPDRPSSIEDKLVEAGLPPLGGRD
ncbi:PAS domain-containing protein [Phenylobacterium sp. LjRoot225]|uniref:HWE histidine kinase domain-containing protein n=1 Tax=Phenylobacterium sp. LjRoot225 TaxID=3342285 RepID=UPI003ECD71B3